MSKLDQFLTITERAYLAAIEGSPLPTEEKLGVDCVSQCIDLIAQELEVSQRALESTDALADDHIDFLVYRNAQRLREVWAIHVRTIERAERAGTERAGKLTGERKGAA